LKKQPHNVIERKGKGTSRAAKLISGMDEEKTIIVTILVALVIIGGLLVYLVFFTPIETEPFAAIYVLDSEKQAENYPKTVVLGENSTFSLWVGVENQNKTQVFSVQIKVDNGTAPVGSNQTMCIETFNRTLLDGGIWEFPATISIDQTGHNRILFELWFLDETKNEFVYTGNYVTLSVEATRTT
jgi:uncharacterized membrane protein